MSTGKYIHFYFPKLVRLCQTYLLSQEEAENLVQDIFLYLWEHPEALESLGNRNAFLFTMVKNRCIDYLRKQTQAQGRKRPLSELEEKELKLKLYSLQAFDESHLSASEIEVIVQNAINTLPERCREIFILSRLEGLRHKQIVEKLNITVNTIESQITIALRKLREELRDYALLLAFLMQIFTDVKV
ncbi:MAG: RNA polymerase sigma-70 factor [Parabacteroides sp.]|nr:RNA polymerase sigma-70 factor [Parabacteroides sp.]